VVNLSAISGMQAASLRVDVVGHNTANVDTDGFRSQRVDQATAAGGGVTASVSTAAAPGVDLAEQAGELVTGSIAYSANAKVLQAQDEIQRTAIDLLA
jgi:flagellar hook protein FlgE